MQPHKTGRMRASFFSQLKAVLWRNLLLKRRNRNQTFQEVFQPLFYVGILIMIRALTRPSTEPALTFPEVALSPMGLNTSQPLFVVDNGLSGVNGLMTDVATQYGLQFQLFATQALADAAYEANKSDVTVGIIFGYPNTSAIEQYAIRMPSSDIASTESQFTKNQGQCRGGDNLNGTGFINCQANLYLMRGFAYLQKIIDEAIMKELGHTVTASVAVNMMPKGEYTSDITSIQTLSSIYFVLAYSFFVNFLAVSLVAEKEKKIREGMFMMGLRNSVFWLSWTIIYVVIIAVVTALVTVVALAGQYFTNSNMFIFFLMLLLYGLSIIGFGFLITPFFNKAKVAGIFASFSSILISLVYLAVSSTRTVTANEYTDGVPASAQWALCLFSPVALALAVDKALYLDVAKGGMHFDDSMTLGDFPLYAPILMLVIDTILYFLLAVYLDHVIPGEYGPRYKPWFFLEKSYWFPQKSRSEDRTHLFTTEEPNDGSEVTGPNIEPMAAEMSSKRTMRVINISKMFKSKEKETKEKHIYAVKNLSLDMYEGQITCLLGHNGAGKTTLINMLTGVTPPTSGTATICGLDVSSSADMVDIRSMCGICPQHNIIYDQLTVKEHLIIFAGIKGVASKQTNAEVVRAMESVGLSDQADCQASKLSGGQKRKLSVAMALIGDPKIIFLDEPTAGMDPYSRRHLWSLLKNSKKGRVILLTTHFMDEADILADRKAIVSHGQLKCCGSSLFLKTKFGIGYHLNMVVEPSCDADKVLDFLQQHVSGVEFDRSHGKELSYTIPLSQVSNFSELFQALEAEEGAQRRSKALGILNYGVSMPSLEEVFLKLGETEVRPENQTDPGASNYNSVSHIDVSISRIGQQGKHTAIPMRARGNSANQDMLSHATVDQPAYCFWMMFKLRFLIFWRIRITLFFLVFLPIGLVTGAMLLYKSASPKSGVTPVPLDLSGGAYINSSADSKLPDFVVQDSANNAISQAIVSHLQSLFSVDSVSPSTSLSASSHYVGAHLKTTASGNLASYTALYNDTAVHSLPAAINAISSAILMQAGSAAKIITSSLPWPGEPSASFIGSTFGSTMMVGIAFALIMPAFSTIVVQEKENKCKNQLRVSGVSFHLYWGSTFVFSLVVALIPATVCLIIALAVQVPSFVPAGAIVIMILLFIVYIPCCLMSALLCSFLFKQYEMASAVLPNVFIWIGMIPYVVVSLIDGLASEAAATAMHYIFVFIDPVYPIFGGFYYIDRLYALSTIFNRELTFGDYFDFDNKIIICIIACIVDLVIMYFALRVLEVRSDGGTVRDALRFGDVNAVSIMPQNQTNSDVIDDEDDDVKQERQKVERLEHGQENSQDTAAYVSQIRKEFAKTGNCCQCGAPPEEKVKLAVRNLSFAVSKGEVFGLLGPNGAGKTTALSMMTADVHPSKGKVVINNCPVKSSMSPAFQHMGFCPQHDPLWEYITLEEHLHMFAAFRGIPKHKIPAVIDFFVENLKVEEHRHKHAKSLSGGTKRKLCYAISMLGCPKIVLLDEPSTGMDPQSKRFLWDTISSSFEGQDRGAILTTHYMEEADALCTRVGIMVNGQMECLGATQHLKAKYGSGYLLEVKIGGSSTASNEVLEERVAALERHLLGLFPNASCMESFAERAQYKIPLSDVPVLSLVFAELERMKLSHNVEEYSFSQSTLEQVFLNFAKTQVEEGEGLDAKEKAKVRMERQLSRSVSSEARSPSAHVVVRM